MSTNTPFRSSLTQCYISASKLRPFNAVAYNGGSCEVGEPSCYSNGTSTVSVWEEENVRELTIFLVLPVSEVLFCVGRYILKQISEEFWINNFKMYHFESNVVPVFYSAMTSELSPVTYEGCYDLSTLGIVVGTAISDNTPQKCGQSCNKLNYNYAGLVQGNRVIVCFV